MRKALRKAKRRGWVLLDNRDNSSTHHILEWKDGTRLTMGSSPSDHRAMKNFMADMRRVERNAP